MRDSRDMSARARLVNMVVAAVTALALTAVVTAAPASSASSKKKTVKRTTTRKRASRATTRATTTTLAPTTVTLPPTTVVTTVAAVATLAPTLPPSTVPPTTVAPFSFALPVQTIYLTLGSSVSFPINLNLRPGFAETISLVPVDLPGGTSISFEQNPVRNFTNATMLVKEGTGILPLITLEGRSATYTAKMKIVVNVVGTSLTTTTSPTSIINTKVTSNSGAFSISINQGGSALVKSGDAGSYKMTIQRAAGVTGPVAFAVSGSVPPGILYSFQENSVAGAENYLFVRAGTLATSGTTFPIVVTATLGAETVAILVTVSVA
jgi:hypothetical protein